MKKGIFYLKDLPRMMNCSPRIREIGWMPDHVYMHRNRTIEAPHLCFNLRTEPGTAKVLINGVLREGALKAPHVGLIRHGAVYHTIQPVRHDELYFIYEPEDYDDLLSLMPENYGFELTHGVQSVLAEILSNLEHLNHPGTADRLDLLAIRLLLETHIASSGKSDSAAVHPRIYEVASYFSTHFMNEIDFDGVIRKFGFSKRSFYRYWRQYSAVSPVQFLLGKRLRYAKYLLENTNMTVQEIAQESGFRNTIYFTQCFSRRFGCSPTGCRNIAETAFSWRTEKME